MTNQISNLRGEQGGIIIDGTDKVEGTWAACMVVAEAVIAEITMPKVENSEGFVGLTLPVGFVIFGYISDITLTSGVVQAFNYTDPVKRAGISA